MKAISKVVDKYGLAGVASFFEPPLTAQAVHKWTREGFSVPADRCATIEIATSGLVTRKDLRPDDWKKYWPELATKETA